MYKLTDGSTVIRISDGAHIPDDLANLDYANYLTWVEDGNTPLPVDLPTIEHQVAEINAECSRRIFAKYDAEKQLSFGQGLYPLAVREACAQYINDCVAESNRLSDCITAGTTAIPNWPV